MKQIYTAGVTTQPLHAYQKSDQGTITTTFTGTVEITSPKEAQVVPDVTREFEIYADPECTRRPSGEVNKVYLKSNVNVIYGNGELFFVGKNDSDNFSTTSDIGGKLSVVWNVDFMYEDASNIITGDEILAPGSIVELTVNEATSVDGLTYSFGNIVYDDPIPPLGEIQVFHDSSCRSYANGSERTVYVRLNRQFGFNDAKTWGSADSDHLNTYVHINTPVNDLPDDLYQIQLWVDWASDEADGDSPFEEGQTIFCIYDNAVLSVVNPHVIFYADGTSSTAPQS